MFASQQILVTGGTGYIGSHTAVELMAADHEVFVVDNLCNSKASVLDRIERTVGRRPGLHERSGVLILNFGTGQGYSVLEMVRAFVTASGKEVPDRIVARCPGNITLCYADPAYHRFRWRNLLPAAVDDQFINNT